MNTVEVSIEVALHFLLSVGVQLKGTGDLPHILEILLQVLFRHGDILQEKLVLPVLPPVHILDKGVDAPGCCFQLIRPIFHIPGHAVDFVC